MLEMLLPILLCIWGKFLSQHLIWPDIGSGIREETRLQKFTVRLYNSYITDKPTAELVTKLLSDAEAYSQPCQRSKMESFAITVNA